jgi:starch phosphorylase
MVRDYVEQMYEPIAARADAMDEGGHARARALAAWKKRVVEAWPGVQVKGVESDDRSAVTDLGTTRKVDVWAALGKLAGDDVAVQLLHGPVGPNDELTDTSVMTLTPGEGDTSGLYHYTGSFTCQRAGRYGIAVRVVPSHPDLVIPAEMGCVAWA